MMSAVLVPRDDGGLSSHGKILRNSRSSNGQPHMAGTGTLRRATLHSYNTHSITPFRIPSANTMHRHFS